MSVIYFLIGCSIVLALLFLGAFFWAMRDGQNDDLYTPSIRMLLDDEKQKQQETPAPEHD